MMKPSLALLLLCGLCLLASPVMAQRRSMCAFGSRILVRPGALVGVRITAHNPSSFSLAWKDPANGGCYTHVEVEVSGPGFPTQRLQVEGYKVTLKGLRAGAMYNVKLTPITLLGSGDPVLVRIGSQNTNVQSQDPNVHWQQQDNMMIPARPGCQLNNAAAPLAVTKLQAQLLQPANAGAPSRIRITFSPTLAGSCARTYTVRVVEQGAGQTPVFDSDTQQTELVIDAQLKHSTRYVVTVIPKNAAGRGDVARAYLTTPQPPRPACQPDNAAAPLAVTQLQAQLLQPAYGSAPSRIRVTFSPTLAGSCARSYTVRLVQQGAGQTPLFDSETRQPELELDAQHLQPNTRYVVIVIPKNAAGRGDVARTFLTTPGSPDHVNWSG